MKKYLLILILIFGICNPVFAGLSLDPTDIGVGARPLGMGKAFTAVSDDGSAIFTNPAGLAIKDNLKFISMSGYLMTEVPYVVLGISRPLLHGNIAIGYAGFGIDGIQEATLVGITPEATGNQASYSNTIINLSYATDIERVVLINKLQKKSSLLRDAKFGASVKIATQAYKGPTVFTDGNTNGIDLDIGYYKRVSDTTTTGLMVKNIFPGNNIGVDELPTTITAGLTRTIPDKKLLIATDLEFNRVPLFHLGLEWNPGTRLALRAGLDQKPSAGSTVNNISFGVGLTLANGMIVNYAYHTYAELQQFTTNYVSIGFLGKDLSR